MIPNDLQLERVVVDLGAFLRRRRWTLVCAESCTGGWIAKAITDVAGISDWFLGSWVTYSNTQKIAALGVTQHTLEAYGAVSSETAMEMAQGALERAAEASVALAVTGVAGPSGGTLEKPVGTVWLGWAFRQQSTVTALHRFTGDREAIRRQAVVAALRGVMHPSS